jgi:hypothetical protein
MMTSSPNNRRDLLKRVKFLLILLTSARVHDRPFDHLLKFPAFLTRPFDLKFSLKKKNDVCRRRRFIYSNATRRE